MPGLRPTKPCSSGPPWRAGWARPGAAIWKSTGSRAPLRRQPNPNTWSPPRSPHASGSSEFSHYDSSKKKPGRIKKKKKKARRCLWLHHLPKVNAWDFELLARELGTNHCFAKSLVRTLCAGPAHSERPEWLLVSFTRPLNARAIPSLSGVLVGSAQGLKVLIFRLWPRWQKQATRGLDLALPRDPKPGALMTVAQQRSHLLRKGHRCR